MLKLSLSIFCEVVPTNETIEFNVSHLKSRHGDLFVKQKPAEASHRNKQHGFPTHPASSKET